MSKTPWPHCSAPEGCTSATREVVGSYRGKRIPEPDGRCSFHKIEDTVYIEPQPEPTATPEEPEEIATVDESPVVVERIESLRESLRSDLITSEVAELIRDQLLEGLRASKVSFATCPHCSHRHPIVLPDLATRINATQKLVEELEGKLQAQYESAEDKLDRASAALVKDRSQMSDAELARAIILLEQEIAEG